MIEVILMSSSVSTWLLVASWAIGFVLANYMIYGWWRILVFIRNVTRDSDKNAQSEIVHIVFYLWACVVSSIVFPVWALFCPVQWFLAIVSCFICCFCVVVWVRFLRMDKEKYVKRAVLGNDFISQHSLDELDYDDLRALGRRKRMIAMYEEFQEIQSKRIDDV